MGVRIPNGIPAQPSERVGAVWGTQLGLSGDSKKPQSFLFALASIVVVCWFTGNGLVPNLEGLGAELLFFVIVVALFLVEMAWAPNLWGLGADSKQLELSAHPHSIQKPCFNVFKCVCWNSPCLCVLRSVWFSATVIRREICVVNTGTGGDQGRAKRSRRT